MAAEHLHSPTPEELMEYVDGEGTPDARAGIEAHLATCPSCQALAAGQRTLSRDVAAWRVAPPPDSLRAPEAPAPVATRSWWVPNRIVLAGVSLVALLAIPLYTGRFSSPARLGSHAEELTPVSLDEARQIKGQAAAGGGRVREGSADTQPANPGESVTSHGPAVIRTATLQLVAKDFSSARTAVDVIVDSSAGFADQLGVSADPGSARVLRGTLRVPGTQLTSVLTRLRALGQVTQDQQNAQDVADQLVDLDARLKSARATEQRLIDLLKNRTGKLSDVLEVEQELTRVRLDIERLDAEKTNMTRRVAYATIDLTISEEHKTAVGPLPLLTQLRGAAVDGLQSVIDMVVGLALFTLRAGPTLVAWALAGAAIWMAARRVRRPRSA